MNPVEVSKNQIYDLLLEMKDELEMTRESLSLITKDVFRIKEELKDHRKRLERIENKLDDTNRTTDKMSITKRLQKERWK